MLWRVPSYSAPGLPRPTISQSTGALLALGPAFGLVGSAFFASGLLGLLGGLALGHALGLLLDLLLRLELELGRRDRRDNGLGIVGQRDPARRGESLERDRVADLDARDVVVDEVRDVAWQRLDVQLARDLLEHASLLDPGRTLGADQIEDHG